MKPALQTLTLALLILVPLSAGADQARTEQWNKHWAVGQNPELRVHAGDAAVTIIGVTGNSIDANVTARGWNIGSGGVEVTEHHMENFVEIDVKVPSVHFNMGARSIHLEVRVPKQLTGDIYTADGSIELREVRGSLRLNTRDGSIRCEDLDGNLDAETGDGSVYVRGRFDSLRVHTGDGSVELNASEGSRLASDWRLQTGDGSVRVRLPRNLSADVDLHTGDGSIHIDSPSFAVNGTRSDHDVRGKLNGGGPALTVRTGDGSITFSS